MCYYYYLDVTLEFDTEDNREVTPAFFKNNIVTALRQLFGDSAASINVDLLKYNQSERRAILRVPRDHYVKLRGSLTVCGSYDGDLCAYRIHKTTPLLLSLLGDSRDYSH